MSLPASISSRTLNYRALQNIEFSQIDFISVSTVTVGELIDLGYSELFSGGIGKIFLMTAYWMN